MDKHTLYRFFDGLASPGEKQAVKQWLDASPEHVKEFFREREFFDAVILSGETYHMTNKDPGRYLFYKVIREVMKIASIIVLTLACGFYFYHLEKQEWARAMNVVTVPAGQRVNLVLPDGTDVWLNARSELRYPAVFTDNKRNIRLKGEAYFEVAPDAASPFVVHVAGCDIEVLGTKFNVEAYEDASNMNVALMEGSVKLTDITHPTHTLLLKPHCLATFADGELSSGPIEDYDLYRWREGLICFKNIDFEQLMRRFEKCYGIEIVVENKKLSNYVVSGKFRISDGVDNALRLLQKDADYTFERNKDNSVIYIK